LRPQLLTTADIALAASLTLLAVAVAVFDLRERRIPNRLVFPAACIGVGLNATRGWGGLWLSLGGLAFGFGLLFIPYLLGAMWPGDVKFLAAVGSFVGASGVLRVFLLTLLCYPALALIFVLKDGKFGVTWLRFRRLLARMLGLFVPAFKLYAEKLHALDDASVASATTPFGVAISAGALLALYTPLLR
jgi:prepilin peptidase CpaA